MRTSRALALMALLTAVTTTAVGTGAAASPPGAAPGQVAATPAPVASTAPALAATPSPTPTATAAPPGDSAAASQTDAAATTACGPGCRLYRGTHVLKADATSVFDPRIEGHLESSTVVWNSQPLMYYRTFINAQTGQRCPGIPQGIAVATSADGGRTWVPRDGGRPLPALRTVYNGLHQCARDDAAPSTWVYAPDVIADGSRLVMAFEQRNRYAGSSRAYHTIRYVTSTDGITWSTSRLLLRYGGVGAWDDEVGTPDLERDAGGGYVLTFHGHDATGQLGQRRAFVRASTVGGLTTAPRTQVRLSRVPSWATYGVGLSDMRREADGYWYILFEAFSGASGACMRADTRTAVGIARSTDLLTWDVRPGLLLNGHSDGLSCGRDMPAFQVLPGVLHGVVTTNDPPEAPNRARRWRIVLAPTPSEPTAATGDRMASNTVLAAGSTLYSANGATELRMQSDGNLVLYRRPAMTPMWATGTNGRGADRAVMQSDGNLVLYRPDGVAVWATGTDGYPGAYALVQTDGNLVVYSGAVALWATGTRL